MTDKIVVKLTDHGGNLGKPEIQAFAKFLVESGFSVDVAYSNVGGYLYTINAEKSSTPSSTRGDNE